MFVGKVAKGAFRIPKILVALKQSRPAGTAFFSASPAREPAIDVHTDLVKTAVKELIEQRGTAAQKTSLTDEQVEKSYQHFKKLLNEARLCIRDCEESLTDEDCKQASDAVDHVYAVYLDMLDDFRQYDGEQAKHIGDIREETSAELKSLRSELDAMAGKIETASSA